MGYMNYDCLNTHTQRNRMNRTGVPIQVNYGILVGQAAIACVPIGAKQEVKAGSVPINLYCDLLNQFN